jgi:hypothetical protein
MICSSYRAGFMRWGASQQESLKLIGIDGLDQGLANPGEGHAVKGIAWLGAGDGTRTRDSLLGRQELYQLSYSRVVVHEIREWLTGRGART